MTQTPNIGLKKIDGNENWRNVFDYHNDSMDLADEAIAGVQAGLTYVENGDTIAANAAYTEGKFICWKGEIYRIRTTINTTVTSSNWTTYLTKQDGIGGALSQINGDLVSLNSNITWTRKANLVTSGAYTIPASASLVLVEVRNTSGGTVFASEILCANYLPLAFVVYGGSGNQATFSVSGRDISISSINTDRAVCIYYMG